MIQSAMTGPLGEQPMSLAAWARLPEDEPGELVDGRLVEDEVPDAPHEVVVMWLTGVLLAWLRERKGRLCGSEMKFAVSPQRGRKPDLSIYFDRARKLPGRGAVDIAPDVMLEVVSPTPRDGRRDRVEKLVDYAAFGVSWYWLVDPRLRTMEILGLREDGHYAHSASASEGTLAIPGCEGLVIDLDAMWRELDESIQGGAEDEPSSG